MVVKLIFLGDFIAVMVRVGVYSRKHDGNVNNILQW